MDAAVVDLEALEPEVGVVHEDDDEEDVECSYGSRPLCDDGPVDKGDEDWPGP